MYDRLGDLLNETLEAGTVKFIRIDKAGNISQAGLDEVNAFSDASGDSKNSNPSSATKETSSASQNARDSKNDDYHAKQQSKKQYVIYKKITPEIERCYRLLDITVSASLEDIKKAYKEKLKYYHPDRHADNPVLLKVATDKTRQVVEAYKMLISFVNG
jgi:DnaJ-domain-containing protein 1